MMGRSRNDESRSDVREAAARQADSSPKLSTFEDLLELAGTRGPWNILIFGMCYLSCFNTAQHTLSYQFLGATPDHWCSVQPLREGNWTQHQIVSLAIPFSNSTGKPASCHMYNYNYTMAAGMGYDAAMANTSFLGVGSNNRIKCYSRDFNLTQYQSTVVTEWDLVCERRVLYSTTQSVVMGGHLVGIFLSGYVADLLGRRRLIFVFSSLYVALSFLVIVSPNECVYIIMKFLTSMLVFGADTSFFVYMMETCATRYRSAVGALLLLPWGLAAMTVSGISYLVRTWKLMQVAFSIPSLLSIVYFVWLPESPRWLIVRGRHAEALKVLTQVAKRNGKTLPPDEQIMSAMTLIGWQSQGKDEGKRRVSVLSHVRMLLRRLVILIVLPQYRGRTTVLLFCWLSCITVYYGVTLGAHNVSSDPYLYMFLGGVSEMVSCLLLWLMLEHLGRRIVFSVLLLVCGITIFIVMALVLLELEGQEWAAVTLSQVAKMTMSSAFQLLWVVTAELYPTKYRSLAMGLSNLFGRMGAMCAPYINDLLGAEHVWAPSALFGSVSLVSAVLTLLLPETGHLNLTEPEDLRATDEKRKMETGEFLSTLHP